MAAERASNRIGYWAERIARIWQDSVEGILDTGRTLIDARAEFKDREVPFAELIGDKTGRPSQLPFGYHAAYRLMTIAADEKILAHTLVLPPSWETLYALSKLSSEKFEELLAKGIINPGMQRKDLKQADQIERRTVRERELGEEQQALPEKRYGVIYADPPWRFEPYSRDTGMDRAADNHYPTEDSNDIQSLVVPAADDCVLFLWATVPMLPEALAVMTAWQFEYKSHFVWCKDKAGTGYWNRNRHELLLIGTRGDIPAPAPGYQYESVIDAPVGEHSAKPIGFREMIEEMFPTLPKLEMFARGGKIEGWDRWGNEVAEAAE